MTRPEPTIFGNCNGWSFIVGKKIRRSHRTAAQIQGCACTRTPSTVPSNILEPDRAAAAPAQTATPRAHKPAILPRGPCGALRCRGQQARTPLASASTRRTDQRILRPLTAAKEHIERLAFIGFGDDGIEFFHAGHLGVGNGHDHVTLLQACACRRIGR